MKKVFGLLAAVVLSAAAMAQASPQEKKEIKKDLIKERNKKADVASDVIKGDFKKANFYMLQDASNTERLTALEKDYKTKSSTDRMQYGSASIVVLHDETISDTLHIIHYRNSFDQVARKVKVVQKEGNWLVDFKYTFDGNL